MGQAKADRLMTKAREISRAFVTALRYTGDRKRTESPGFHLQFKAPAHGHKENAYSNTGGYP
jgi:hypothetical protein